MNQENPLAVLVKTHCENTGDSLAAIAARGGMSRGTLSGLVNGGRTFPRASTLEALARGLDLPYETVRAAAVRNTLGDSPTAEPRRLVVALMAHAEGLTDDQLEVVLATARAVKRHAATA
jgi:transcriptional regulator with XRE-family HTH domain